MPLSSKDLERLALAWQCFDTEPKIDYAKFAEVAGLASAASARELMRVTKNKLKNEYGALSSGLQKGAANGGAAVTPKRKGAGTPKKGGGGGGGEGGGTPTPTPTPRKRKAGAKLTEGGGEEGGEDGKGRKKTKASGGEGMEGEGSVSPVKEELVADAEGDAGDFGFF